MEWLKGLVSKFQGTAQSAADSMPLPSVATSDAPQALGLPAEPAGMTVTGGRRHRKTRRGGKRHTKKRLHKRK